MNSNFQHEERDYTHCLEFRYKENMNKREYIPYGVQLPPEEEVNVIWSRLEFSLNPLLCDSFMNTICLEDRIKIVKAANPRNLWLFARMHHLEITSNAIKPSRAGTDTVEIADRNVILKKHVLYLKEESEKKEERPMKPHCLVVNDDRVPTLPIFELNDEETKQFLFTCFGLNHIPTNTAGIAIPNPWTQQMKERTFQNTFHWQNRVQIVPYMLLPRSVWNCEEENETNGLKWCGIFNAVDGQYMKRDAVAHEMLYFVSVHNNFYKLLGISNEASLKEIETAFLNCVQPLLATAKEDDQKQIEELRQAYEVLSKPSKRANYDNKVKNLQNSKFWQMLKQKPTHLLQVVAVMPVEQHNRIYGTPKCLAEEPLLYKIGQEPQRLSFYETWETFYIQNPNLFNWLKEELSAKTTTLIEPLIE
jgi:hypothetical protein